MMNGTCCIWVTCYYTRGGSPQQLSGECVYLYSCRLAASSMVASAAPHCCISFVNAQAHAYRASRRSRARCSHACRASRRSTSSSRATCLRRSRTPVMTASVALSWPFARDCSMMKRLSSTVMGAYCIAFLASPSNCRGGGGGAAILPDLKSTRTSPTPELLRVATRLLARRRIVRVAADIGALERAELALGVRPS